MLGLNSEGEMAAFKINEADDLLSIGPVITPDLSRHSGFSIRFRFTSLLMLQ